MYGRKVQQIKKKKAGLMPTAESCGSNWGPRIALFEREQQLLQESKGGGNSTKQQYYDNCTSNYGQQFKNPCAINGGHYLKQNEKSDHQFYPGIGKYLRNANARPLQVMIPPQDKFHLHEFNQNANGKRNTHTTDSLPSTETYRSTDHENDSQSANSMTRTTVVPSDDEEDDDLDRDEDNNGTGQRSTAEYEPLCKCDSPVRSGSGASKQFQKRAAPGYTTSGPKAIGFSMVYVPMETSVRRPKLLSPSNTALDTPSGERSPESSLETSVSQSGTRAVGRKNSAETSPGAAGTNVIKDPDNDSLLESFDSVIFKPKFSPKISAIVAGPGPGAPNKKPNSKGKPDESPPPLPPKNLSPQARARAQAPLPLQLAEGKKNLISKSLRFADNLDMKRNSQVSSSDVKNANVKVSQKSQSEQQKVQISKSHNNNSHKNGGNSGGGGEATTKVTAASCSSDPSYDETNFCYTSCKSDSELLTMSCGHTQDNYSTLSSIQSQQSENGSKSSPKISEKSALQQLRDLSILIGGSFHTTPPHDEQMQHQKTAIFLAENDLKIPRKSSDATSADSGKGSANDACTSNSIPNSNSNSNSAEATELLSSSTGNSNCSCAESSCIFRPECEECQMFFKNPFEKMPIFCTDIATGAGEYGGSKRKSSGGSSSSSKNSKKANKFTKNVKQQKQQQRNLLKPLIVHENFCGGCDRDGNKPITKTQLLLRKSEGFLLHKKFRSKRSPGGNSNSSSGNSIDPNLFTIDEEASLLTAEENNTITNSSGHKSNRNYGQLKLRSQSQQQSQEIDNNRNSKISDDQHYQHASTAASHFHPKCWLAPDATMGWSDLESLYSQNLKRDQPIAVNGECWTCWREMSQFKYNSPESNRTVDRTKRMFIWLNKRPKEFNAPWWEAKKQASIKWLASKAYAHLPNNAALQDPFKESKRDKTKFRMREEIIVGLANGKLYCMALDNLYQKNRQKRAQGLSHWEIIKILSRRGVYVAQPSDMKLTEGTLRQKKPLRIAAHIALIEAIMGLYAKELVTTERILPILSSLGQELDSDSEIPEHLIITWINSAMNTMKSYILTNNRNKSLNLTSAQIQRWLRIPPVGEIRDLNDGVGLCCLLSTYFSSELSLEEIAVGVGEPEETLSIYDMILNHTLVQKVCQTIFPEQIYHLCITDFLYIHGYMKQNILSFLVDLFYHLEVNPIVRVNRLTHVPLRVQL